MRGCLPVNSQIISYKHLNLYTYIYIYIYMYIGHTHTHAYVFEAVAVFEKRFPDEIIFSCNLK